MKYEDNSRSDYDKQTTPGIVLGGYGKQMSYANIATEVEFSPNGIGKFFLWNITANNGCSLGTSGSGSFVNGKTVSHVVHPSDAVRALHDKRNDIVISVGFDANGDGILQNDEESVPDFQNRLIGKKEYDYCLSQLMNWQNFFGGVVWSDAGELLRIFADRNYVGDYNSSRTVTQGYGANYSQDQSNGLGFDESQNIKQGTITEYVWNSFSNFGKRILSDINFYNDIIKHAIREMNIEEYYRSHPNVDTHTFFVVINKNLLFPPDSDNLHNSLKHCDISFLLTLHTKRGNGTPQITGIEGNGACKDLYDFRTYEDPDNNGFASRVQTCHLQGIRDAGEIFRIYVNLTVSGNPFSTSIDYNDFDKLYLKWLMLINPTNYNNA
jgi:hypothetical protein